MARSILSLLGVLYVIAGAVVAMAQVPSLGDQDPSDPSEPVPATTYRPVTSGLQSFRPADPLPWGSQNEKVAPKPKAGGEGSAPEQQQ